MGVSVSWDKLRAGDKPTSLHFELSLRADSSASEPHKAVVVILDPLGR